MEKAAISNARIDDVINTVLARVLAPIDEEIPIEEPEKAPQKRAYISNRRATLAQCNICGLMLKHPSKIAVSFFFDKKRILVKNEKLKLFQCPQAEFLLKN